MNLLSRLARGTCNDNFYAVPFPSKTRVARSKGNPYEIASKGILDVVQTRSPRSLRTQYARTMRACVIDEFRVCPLSVNGVVRLSARDSVFE